jgi:ribosomal protein S18 acetylase RimI-like enzyme
VIYSIELERGDKNYAELEPNYRKHYAEMKARLQADGVDIGEYKPRLDQYFEAFAGGWLLNYVVRFEGKPVGHSNVYLTQDMHNSDLIAQEDTIYILPKHRNGIGKKLVKHILADLEARGVKRVTISPVTDLRVGKIWRRMGFKPVAELMTYQF